MRRRAAVLSLAAAVVVMGPLMTACSNSPLSATSTCQQFSSASSEAQQALIVKLSSQYNKTQYSSQGITDPLGWQAEIDYCASNPNVTVGQAFANLQA